MRSTRNGIAVCSRVKRDVGRQRSAGEKHMLDELIPMIEQIQLEGALVLLKWDGERSQNRCTVVVTRSTSGYTFRRDSDDVVALLREALNDYRANHER
jgi:hypothetical protein